MDKYVVSPSDRFWHVFDEQHAVDFREDELFLCHMRPWYKDPKKSQLISPHTGPYFNLPTLRRQTLAEAITKTTLPVELRFSGHRVGGTHRYSGRDAADMGSQSRDITDLSCRLELDRDDLRLQLWMRASPLHAAGRQQPDPNDRPEARYELPIPFDEVQLVLDLRPSEYRAFRERVAQS